jgi:hypothetical protein
MRQLDTETVIVQTEFDEVINQMVKNQVSCVDDYRDWVSIGFGLADHFGERGRDYFHALSAISNKYEKSIWDTITKEKRKQTNN